MRVIVRELKGRNGLDSYRIRLCFLWLASSAVKFVLHVRL